MNMQAIGENALSMMRRGYYRIAKRRKLKNKNPTIIASDCFGSLMYANLGLRFNSPTINLFFSREDFITFCQNLPGFLKEEVQEVTDETVNYPVGQITADGRTIRINFRHYHSFEEAKAKWNERKQRVDYTNIFIVLVVASGIRQEDVTAFDALPFENKMLVVDRKITDSPSIVTHKVFSQKNYRPGMILRYKTNVSLKRYMDDIDYVSFLNQGF